MVELVWRAALAIPMVLVVLVLAAFWIADWIHFVAFVGGPVVRLYRALRGRVP